MRVYGAFYIILFCGKRSQKSIKNSWAVAICDAQLFDMLWFKPCGPSIFLFVEEIIDAIVSVIYTYCLVNRQAYLVMKDDIDQYGKRVNKE